MPANKIKHFHALIVAAGSGGRFGGPVPKQYERLAGKPTLRWTIQNFQIIQGLKTLRVVINPEHLDLYKGCTADLRLEPPAYGGKTRNESVFLGLKSFSNLEDDEIILVHDAARPFVDPAQISALLMALEDHDAAALALPVTDTLRRIDGASVSRDDVWMMQTPQAFRYGTLKKAHEAAEKKNYTDDAGLVSALGVPVKLVEGSKRNLKITVPEDMSIAEAYFLDSMETRTGMGFDVHAFSKEEGRKLILCGVEIDHPYGLEGHSDADVGLHALTDALLGAVGGGDIGEHYPPSDIKFKNMDSRRFVEGGMDILRNRDALIVNADITIICESPKIGPYRSAMRETVSDLLDIAPERVNIKATTTEGLGFTGRREGIAAQAIVSVRIGKERK